jgi:hypothetical protein
MNQRQLSLGTSVWFFSDRTIFLTDENVLVFFTYHGFLTITTSSHIISRDKKGNTT